MTSCCLLRYSDPCARETGKASSGIPSDELRARTETGRMLYTHGGIAFGAGVSYDAMGASDDKAIGGRARVKVPLD